MFTQIMQRRVLSDSHVALLCQTAFSIVGVVVLVSGFKRIERLELTEEQLYSACNQTLLLTAAFVGLALIVQHWRRTGSAKLERTFQTELKTQPVRVIDGPLPPDVWQQPNIEPNLV